MAAVTYAIGRVTPHPTALSTRSTAFGRLATRDRADRASKLVEVETKRNQADRDF